MPSMMIRLPMTLALALSAALSLVVMAGCHEASQPSAEPESAVPIVPPFASGLIEEPGDPAHPDASVMGAMALIMSYRERLNRDPNDLEALVFLGNATYDIKNYPEAEALYRRALAIDPTIVQVRTDLATALHRQGRSREAIDELQRVLVVDYRHPTALYNLGLLKLNVLGDTSGAIAMWEQLLEATEDPELTAKVQGMIDAVRKGPSPAAPPPTGRPGAGAAAPPSAGRS